MILCSFYKYSTSNFLLKKTRQKSNGQVPVYVRFTLHGRRVELSTGISVHPDNWDEAGQQILGRSHTAQVINNRLDKIYSEIQDCYNQFKATGKKFNVTSIKNRLQNIEEGKSILEIFDYYLNSILVKLNKGYSMKTYKHYKSSRKRLAGFIEFKYKKTDFPLNDINYRFLDAFDIYLKQEFKVHQNTAWNYHFKNSWAFFIKNNSSLCESIRKQNS